MVKPCRWFYSDWQAVILSESLRGNEAGMRLVGSGIPQFVNNYLCNYTKHEALYRNLH